MVDDLSTAGASCHVTCPLERNVVLRVNRPISSPGFSLVLVFIVAVGCASAASPGAQPQPKDRGDVSGHWVTFEGLTDVEAAACGSNDVFLLREGGRVSRCQTAGFEPIDWRGDCRQIAADGNLCYVLKTNGSVWQWKETEYREILGGRAVMMSASRDTLHVLLEDGSVSRYRPSSGWASVPGGPETVFISSNSRGLVATGKNGKVFRFSEEDHSWRVIYDRSDAKMAAGDEGKAFILTRAGSVWLDETGLEQVDSGSDTDRIFCLGFALYALKKNGEVWTFDVNHERALRKVYAGRAPRDLAVFRDEHLILHHHLFVVEGDGTLLQDNFGIHGSSAWGRMDRFEALQK